MPTEEWSLLVFTIKVAMNHNEGRHMELTKRITIFPT